MLSNLTYRCLFNKAYIPYLRRVSQICLYVGLFWLTMVNFILTCPLYISENAFNTSPHSSLSDFNSTTYKALINSTFTDLLRLRLSPSYNDSTSTVQYLTNRTSQLDLETFVQEFPVYTGAGYGAKGRNVYTYLRAKRSSHKDCLLIAYRHSIDQYNMAYHLAVSNVNAKKVARYGELVTVLTLMEHLRSQEWLSRDVIFLGYDGELQYGTAVRHFLKEYHYGSDGEFVRGGVIKQGIALEFKTDTFNTYGLQFRIAFRLTI